MGGLFDNFKTNDDAFEEKLSKIEDEALSKLKLVGSANPNDVDPNQVISLLVIILELVKAIREWRKKK